MTETGRITKRVAPFTMMSNHAITDERLSTAAKGLYAIIAYYTNIPNFELYRTKLESMLPEGNHAFRKMWNELKDNGYLIVHRTNTQGGFVYSYELLDCPEEIIKEVKQDQQSKAEEAEKAKRMQKKIKRIAKKADKIGVFPNSRFSTSGEPTSGFATSGESTNINNNISNKTILNNTIYNNQSIENQKTEDNFKDDQLERMIDQTQTFNSNESSFDDVYESIRQNNTNQDFDTYYNFAWKQVNAIEAIPLAKGVDTDSNIATQMIQECVLAMAEIYSEQDSTFRIGQKTYNTKSAKQRLLKLNQFSFQGIIINLKSKQGELTNPAAYIKTMLLNGASSNGRAQNQLQALL